MDAASTPPSYPFHLAKAYAASQVVRPAPLAVTTASGMTVRASGDSVELSAQRPVPLQQSVTRLAGAKVEKAADFVTSAPVAGGALPMYRHPADKNAAATGVQVGRMVDFEA